MPLQHTARPRIDPDIDLKFEPGMGAGIDRVRSHGARVLLHPRAGCQLVWHFPCQLRGISKFLLYEGSKFAELLRVNGLEHPHWTYAPHPNLSSHTLPCFSHSY